MRLPNCSPRRIEEVVSETLAALKGDAERTLEALAPLGSRRNTFGLTATERNVLRLVGLGLSNEEIGRALFISPETVRTHVKNVHDKCGIKGRARLAVTAYRILEQGA